MFCSIKWYFDRCLSVIVTKHAIRNYWYCVPLFYDAFLIFCCHCFNNVFFTFWCSSLIELVPNFWCDICSIKKIRELDLKSTKKRSFTGFVNAVSIYWSSFLIGGSWFLVLFLFFFSDIF